MKGLLVRGGQIPGSAVFLFIISVTRFHNFPQQLVATLHHKKLSQWQGFHKQMYDVLFSVFHVTRPTAEENNRSGMETSLPLSSMHLQPKRQDF